MKILIAPDSFKETLSASEVCDIIACALQKVDNSCDITKLPVADGGEGLCCTLMQQGKGKYMDVRTVNPYGEPITARYLLLDGATAAIETASCIGLPLISNRKNPIDTNTFGVGMMIADCVRHGAKHILLGLGGSATNDCGTGVAAALGYRFFDGTGNEIHPCGRNLICIERILPPVQHLKISVTAACDVKNPLYGREGAAYVFAPQKGADAAAVELLDKGLRNISNIIERDLGIDVSDLPGAGAAGGLGAGAVAFLNAELKSGIDIVLDAVGFDDIINTVDLVITGEGKLDSQSFTGKTVGGICRRAAMAGIPVVAVCGCAEDTLNWENSGISGLYVSSDNISRPIEVVKKTCKQDLFNAALKMSTEILNENRQK